MDGLQFSVATPMGQLEARATMCPTSRKWFVSCDPLEVYYESGAAPPSSVEVSAVLERVLQRRGSSFSFAESHARMEHVRLFAENVSLHRKLGELKSAMRLAKKGAV
jgi:hypothetical protein